MAWAILMQEGCKKDQAKVACGARGSREVTDMILRLLCNMITVWLTFSVYFTLHTHFLQTTMIGAFRTVDDHRVSTKRWTLSPNEL